MLVIVGAVVVILCVIGSYVAMGGKLSVLNQPFEFVIIGGSGLGAFLIANPMPVVKKGFGAMIAVMKGPKYKKADYLELLMLQYQIFRLAKTKGMLALEAHVENPHDSPLFQQFPRFSKDHHAVEFMCDYLLTVGGHLYLLAVNSQPPKTAIVLRTSLPGSAMLRPGDVPMRRPVVFSYNHPWGSDKNPNAGWTDPWFMDFARVRLSTANMVDHVDPKAYAPWRTPDRRILARVRQWATPWQDDKANDLIKAWDEALSRDGIDGFAMDEFIGKDATPELITAWATAIEEIRKLHSDKVLAFWCDSGLGRIREYGTAHQTLLEAIRDHADFIMPEIYYTEKNASGFLTDPQPFGAFRQKVEEWEAQAPGIKPKILMGLGTVQNADWGYDNVPEIDYAEFLAKQVEVCATDPVLMGMGGLALYAPGYLRPEVLGAVDDAIIEFYGLSGEQTPEP